MMPDLAAHVNVDVILHNFNEANPIEDESAKRKHKRSGPDQTGTADEEQEGSYPPNDTIHPTPRRTGDPATDAIRTVMIEQRRERERERQQMLDPKNWTEVPRESPRRETPSQSSSSHYQPPTNRTYEGPPSQQRNRVVEARSRASYQG